MGMYTQLQLDVRLKSSTPDKVVNVLNLMCDEADRGEEFKNSGIKHPFFKTWRGSWMFRGSSAYFDEWHVPKFVKNEITELYELSVCFNIKNYEQEIQKFLDWITPYVFELDGTPVGTYQYEEDDEPSTIIWNKGKFWILRGGNL